MSSLWVDFLVIIGYYLLAWLFGFCSKRCGLGRLLGYFLASVLYIYVSNNFLPTYFYYKITDHFVFSFILAYLGLHFFKATQYLKIKEIRKFFKINILIAVIPLSIMYFSPSDALLVIFIAYLIIYSLVNNKRFLQESNLKPIFYQAFVYQAIIIICYMIALYDDKISLLKNSLFYVIPLIIIFSLLSYWLSHKHHSKNIKELKGALDEDSLPSKNLFCFISLIFFTCTYFLSESIFAYSLFLIVVIILGFFTINFLNKKIYDLVRLLDEFHLGQILFSFYLATLFDLLLDTNYPHIKTTAIFLICNVIVSLLLYLFLRLRLRYRHKALYITFVSSLGFVFLFIYGYADSILILSIVIGNALFHFSLKNKKSSPTVTEVANKRVDFQ